MVPVCVGNDAWWKLGCGEAKKGQRKQKLVEERARKKTTKRKGNSVKIWIL